VLNKNADFSLKLSLIVAAMMVMGLGAALQYVTIISATIVICKEKYYGIFFGTLTAAKNVLNFILTISFEPSLPSTNGGKPVNPSDETSTYKILIFYCFILNCICALTFIFLQIYDQNQKLKILSKIAPQDE
jgi:hypothetical protein